MDSIPVKIEAGDGWAQLLCILNRIAVALEKLSEADATPKAAGAPAPEAEPAPDPVEERYPVEDESPFPDPAAEAPGVTLKQIRQRVVQLAVAGKKDAVRAIVMAYADSVPNIPEDKYAEVWAKLSVLEG